jgi:hypothetical protein
MADGSGELTSKSKKKRNPCFPEGKPKAGVEKGL